MNRNLSDPPDTGTFTALDFETAQPSRWSICQIGLVRFVQGKRTDALSWLVQPPENYYWSRFTAIHGIRSEHTVNAPCFAEIWPQISHFIENQTVVAHNGAFDFSCLRQALEYHGLTQPDYTPRCTYRIYRKGLAELCSSFNIALQHHDALSDATACAGLYLRHLRGEG